MTAAIAYRSPLGRVRCYDGKGRITLALEPGTEADVMWEALAPAIRSDKSAYWIDKVVEAEQRISALPTKEKTMTEKTERTDWKSAAERRQKLLTRLTEITETVWDLLDEEADHPVAKHICLMRELLAGKSEIDILRELAGM